MLVVAKLIGGIAFGMIGILMLFYPKKFYDGDQRLAPFVKSFPVYRALLFLIGIPFTCVGIATIYRIVVDSIK